MGGRVYRLTEIVGTSTESIEKAIETAIDRARATVRQVSWFEVVTTRGFIHPERGVEYQVTLKVGFQVED